MQRSVLYRLFLGVMVGACTACVVLPVRAQQEVKTRNLTTELDSGRVTLGKIKGTGGSSGPALDAELTNTTSKEIQLDISLDEPLFLANQGAGQNMFVLGVVGKSGGYMMSGSKAFISLPAKKKTHVRLLSYCADFEKENPARNELFAVDTVGEDIKPVLGRIMAHQRQHPGRDITRAAQIAIWMAQGEDADAILQKFRYSLQDLTLAKEFVGKDATIEDEP